MNFKTARCSTDGTSLIGYVDVTYAKLVEVFGEPNAEGCDKSDAEWAVEFVDGTIATIYNYKDGVNYRGINGKEVEDITDWHVGGRARSSNAALELVAKVLGVKGRPWNVTN